MKIYNYRLIGVILIPLSSLLLNFKTNAQSGILNDKEALKIICKALKYNSAVDNDIIGEFVHYPTIEKKRFQLKTSTYYKQLIDDKVLKVVSETNDVFTYGIEDSYKSYIISMDEKTQTVWVQTVGLRLLSTWKKLEFSNPNEATAFIYTEYGMSPFYNTGIRTNFNGAQGWLLKIKYIKINGVWKLKDPVGTKKQIETIKTDIQPSIENIYELKTTSVIKDGLNYTPGNMPYRLYKGKGTQQIKAGDFIKIQLTQKIKDSIYFSTLDGLPTYLQVNTQPSSYDISELWTSLRIGDSVVATQMMDTFIKRSPQSIPSNFKKGDKITTYIKVLAIFKNDSEANADYENLKTKRLTKEIEFIEKYLAKKNITAKKTTSGAFVQVINPGTGNQIDSGRYVTVNYTGTSFSGKVFDSNTDASFHHVEPYSFNSGAGEMIKGFDEAVLFMKKGATAKVYIPSLLAYGANPNSPLIKPFEHLIFDIEIVDVK